VQIKQELKTLKEELKMELKAMQSSMEKSKKEMQELLLVALQVTSE
jgi:hypothetical protein